MRSLAIIGNAQAIPALRQIADQDQDKTIRRAAARTITAIEKAEQRRADREARRPRNSNRRNG
jgi:hypothetical protein